MDNGAQPWRVAETETRTAIKAGNRTIAYVQIGALLTKCGRKQPA